MTKPLNWQVTTVVENCPEKFNVFMGILAEFQWLSYLVEVVQEQYEINQKNEVSHREMNTLFCQLPFSLSYNIIMSQS